MQKSLKWLTLLSGIIYIGVGIFFILNPIENILMVSWLIALNFALSAISRLLAFFTTDDKDLTRLLYAVLLVAFAIFLLTSGYAILPLIVATGIGIWLVTSSILLLYRLLKNNRQASLLSSPLAWLALLSAVVGLYIIARPLSISVLIAYLLATIFIVNGLRHLQLSRFYF